jgi:hypothetical protein
VSQPAFCIHVRHVSTEHKIPNLENISCITKHVQRVSKHTYVLANKLKALKTDLKKWNEEVFGEVGKKKKELLEGVRELDLVEECCCLEEDERV